MRSPRSAVRLALAVVMGAAALACGFADVFRPAGSEPVTITYVGDTIIHRDSTVPFRVVVEAGSGTPPASTTTRNGTVLSRWIIVSWSRPGVTRSRPPVFA